MTELERQVMEFLLAGDDPTLEVLRAQLQVATVAARELTGVGFFTSFAVPRDVIPVDGRKSFRFGDVSAKLDGLERGAGFVLFVDDGTIHFLEGYTYDEAWPTNVGSHCVHYDSGPSRDIEEVRKKWAE